MSIDPGLHRDRLAAFGPNGVRHVLGFFGARDVIHSNVGAFIGKDFRDTAADAAARPGDECAFSSKSHVLAGLSL